MQGDTSELHEVSFTQKSFQYKTHTEYSGKTPFNNMTRQLTSWMIFNLDSASSPLALIMKDLLLISYCTNLRENGVLM